MRIVLIGMMGSGKSTVGSLVAARCGWRYVDNDEDVRALTTLDAADVITVLGETELHAAEAAAFLGALKIGTPVVIAAAAGVIVEDACAEALRREPTVFYLRARLDTLRHRIGGGQGRRSDATDVGWMEARLAERDALYQSLATWSIDVDEDEPARVADIIIERVGL
jgi:shikimate kinase